ncbi:MAG: MOSC domain-containing protein, partial [Fidelibacterota bacterium]
MTGKIFRINVKPETIGERGLPKSPVKSAMATFPGVEGDFNRYRHEKKNDDPDMAILLITSEVIGRLNNEGWPVRPGDLGENITARGIPYNEFSPGKSYRIGRATLEI